MKLKPIPRLILIATVVGGGIFGAIKFTGSQDAAVSSAPAPSSPAPAATVAQPTPVANTPASAAAQAGSALKNILEKGVVRAGVQSPADPFFLVDRGQAKGFNVDFMKVLFAQPEFQSSMGAIEINTETTVDTYDEVPQTLLKRDHRGAPVVDVAIDGLTFTDTDLPGVVYTVPYIDDFGYSLIAAPGGAVRTHQDMNGATIGILKGDPDVRAYVQNQFPGAKLVELSDASTPGSNTRDWISRAISGGQVDAIVYDYPFAVAEIRGTKLQFVSTKLPSSRLQYKIGVRQEDRDLLEKLNIAIRKAKATESYGDLIRRYFSSGNIAKARGAESGEKSYVVKAGDTLSLIAGAQLGDAMRYGEIEARNNLPNPNLIQVGQALVIPHR
jgi:ABC-type amino acid transport substrate-binding protein